jgi:hypothetical protein
MLMNVVFWDITPCDYCRNRRSSETSILTRATWHNGILHSHRLKNFKSYTELTRWPLQRRRNMSPVRYELGFFIPEDEIHHSHRRGNLNSYPSNVFLPNLITPTSDVYYRL